MIFRKNKEYGGTFDYMIVGLGNPGRQYEGTRHNAGFICIDLLEEKYSLKINKLKFRSLLGEARISGSRCLILKPQTFMNLSGESVREAATFH